jgi:hypothetical protein
MVPKSLLLIIGLTTGFGSICCQAADNPIAGTTPWQRPTGAPVITSVDHDSAWFRRALTGISRPYPSSLRFLDDQGNWYTPFNRAGMTGPYDIRGWHQPEAGIGPE